MQTKFNQTPQPSYLQNVNQYYSEVESIIKIPDQYQSIYQKSTCKEVSEKVKVICLIGITGSGKSTTANTLCGIQNAFEESSKVESCTSETRGQFFQWPKQNIAKNTKIQKQHQNTPFIIIDTPGLCDNNGKDNENMVQMVCFLKNLQYVNSFVICFNSQESRLDENKLSILKLFAEMFGKDFYNNVILCFTRWSYDKKEINARKRKGQTQETLIFQVQQQFQEKFQVTLKDEQFILIDNEYSIQEHRNDSDPEEIQKNAQQLEILHQKTINNKAFWCKDVKQVMKENDKLQLEIQKQLEAQLKQQKLFQQKLKKQDELAQQKLQEIKYQSKIKQQQLNAQIEYEKQQKEEEIRIIKQQQEKERQQKEKQAKELLQKIQQQQEEQQQLQREKQQLIKKQKQQEQQREKERIRNEQIQKEYEEKERERQRQREQEQEQLRRQQEQQEEERRQREKKEKKERKREKNMETSMMLASLMMRNSGMGMYDDYQQPMYSGYQQPMYQSYQQPMYQSYQQPVRDYSFQNSQLDYSSQSSRHTGKRCADGTLDMRYKENKGWNKYDD